MADLARMAPGAIVFDLDGTLVHSASDIAAAANRALAEEGAPPLPLAVVTGFIGDGIPTLAARMAARAGIEPARVPGLTARVLAHYRATPVRHTVPYPGVAAALDRLAAAGHALGVCTNNAADLAQAVLHTLGLAGRFAVVIGGDGPHGRKPDPAPLHAAFAALGAPPLLFVGDSAVDAETAARAGVPFALYTEGYRKAPADSLPHAFAFSDWAAFLLPRG